MHCRGHFGRVRSLRRVIPRAQARLLRQLSFGCDVAVDYLIRPSHLVHGRTSHRPQSSPDKKSSINAAHKCTANQLTQLSNASRRRDSSSPVRCWLSTPFALSAWCIRRRSESGRRIPFSLASGVPSTLGSSTRLRRGEGVTGAEAEADED